MICEAAVRKRWWWFVVVVAVVDVAAFWLHCDKLAMYEQNTIAAWVYARCGMIGVVAQRGLSVACPWAVSLHPHPRAAIILPVAVAINAVTLVLVAVWVVAFRMYLNGALSW